MITSLLSCAYHYHRSINPVDTDQGTMVLAAIVDVSQRTKMAAARRIADERLALVVEVRGEASCDCVRMCG